MTLVALMPFSLEKMKKKESLWPLRCVQMAGSVVLGNLLTKYRLLCQGNVVGLTQAFSIYCLKVGDAFIEKGETIIMFSIKTNSQ